MQAIQDQLPAPVYHGLDRTLHPEKPRMVAPYLRERVVDVAAYRQRRKLNIATHRLDDGWGVELFGGN